MIGSPAFKEQGYAKFLKLGRDILRLAEIIDPDHDEA